MIDVILIRGAPGMGKSTLGELLRGSFPAGALVDVDIIRGMLVAEKFIYKADQHYIVAIQASSELVEQLLSLDHRPIIVVDVFAEPFLKLFLSGLHTRNIAKVSLVADDEVLWNRMSSRSKGFVNLNAARALNTHIRLTTDDADITCDTSLLNPYGVRKVVLKHLMSRYGAAEDSGST